MDALTRIALTLAGALDSEKERTARLERMQADFFKSTDQQRTMEELLRWRDGQVLARRHAHEKLRGLRAALLQTEKPAVQRIAIAQSVVEDLLGGETT